MILFIKIDTRKCSEYFFPNQYFVNQNVILLAIYKLTIINDYNIDVTIVELNKKPKSICGMLLYSYIENIVFILFSLF